MTASQGIRITRHADVNRPLRFVCDPVSAVCAALFSISSMAAYASLLHISWAVPLFALTAATVFFLVLTPIPDRIIRWSSAGVGILSVLLLALIPACRTGLLSLLWQLFRISEAGNRYHYILPGGETLSHDLQLTALTATLLCVFFASVAVFFSKTISAVPVLLWTIAFAGIQVYFGVTPGVAEQLLFFATAAVLILGKQSKTGISGFSALFSAAIIALFLAVLIALCFPGVHHPLENFSETVRDRLEQTDTDYEFPKSTQTEDSDPVHEESRFHETAAEHDPDADSTLYEKQTEEQSDISKPEWNRKNRTVLMVILLLLLLTLPFVPFYYFDRCRKKAQKRRELFSAEDTKTAVCAMFSHIADCLYAAGVPDENQNYSELPDHLPELFDAEYRNNLEGAYAVYRTAAYSHHPLTKAQREIVSDLLKKTEKLLYEHSTLKEKFRLKYGICLLTEPDEEET